MADDRNGDNGFGDGQDGNSKARLTPPDPQPNEYTTDPHVQQQGRQGGPRCLLVGLLVGCGCLTLISVVALLLGIFAWGWFEQEPDPQTQMESIDQESAWDEEAAPDGVSEPGEAAALAWARERQPTWRAAVDDHTEDWSWVMLVMAPEGPEWTTWVELRWDEAAGRYTLLAEGPLAQDDGDYGDAPEIFRPGEQVAREAALGYVEQPDWVTRIDSHTPDWRRVTVSVGPPASEWVWVVTLQWDPSIDAYGLVSVDEVDYPGF